MDDLSRRADAPALPSQTSSVPTTDTPSTPVAAAPGAAALRPEEPEVFGAAGPILIFIFVLWGLTMAAAATAVS
ncbi:MAG: hypothetical protein KDE35_06655 [Geminicoccaceae bacterium]|nr:hypothetical protein [Geminicoccaceae bacterium]